MSVEVFVLSLLLVLAAAGVLVASVLAGEPQWAWISVACSGLGGVLLLVERFRRRRTSPSGARPRHALTRRARRSAQKEKSGAESEASTATMAPVATSDESAGGSGEAGADASAQPENSAARNGDTDVSKTAAAGSGAAMTETSTLSASGSAEPAEPDSSATEAEPVEPDSPDVEPDEEQTDAADVALVSEAEDQVVVIDERPRYHLKTCAWLGSRRTIPLPAREARELAFSPCALCEPDATLVQQLRGRE